MPWLNKDGLADVIARSKSYAKSLFKIGSVGSPGILAPDGTSITVDENGTISSPNNTYRELTKEEYDALTEEEKNNGTIYFITDAYDANAITVDNALSTESTNAVQNKIITECINDMNDSLDIVKAHVKETGNVHGLTLSDLGFENVENKSSADIRGELTKEDIIKALGYEPSEGNGGNGTGGSEPSNPSVTLKTFDQATNEEIIQMVKAADAGEIDLAEDCGWEVGQEHVITLPAIAASGSYDGQSWEINDSTKMQSVTLVLMENGINQTFDLVNSVKNKNGTTRNKPSFIVGLKDCVSSVLNINPSNNVGSWHNSSGRSWCNGGFRQAMESQLPNIFKQFKTITATEYNSTTNQMSIDYFSLFAEKEVFGIRTNSNETEANALKQVSYYNISNNRIKNWNGMSSKAQWALRSPNCQSTVRFCSVFVDGTAECFIVGNTVGFAPFGCI